MCLLKETLQKATRYSGHSVPNYEGLYCDPNHKTNSRVISMHTLLYTPGLFWPRYVSQTCTCIPMNCILCNLQTATARACKAPEPGTECPRLI